MVADIEELEKMDASEIHAWRLNTKEVLTHQNGEHFTLQIADGEVKLSGGDQALRTTIAQNAERNKKFFWRIRRLLQPHFETHRGMMVKLEMISGPFQALSFHHVEPRVKLYVPNEASFPIPLRYIDVARTSSTTLDVMLERRVDDD